MSANQKSETVNTELLRDATFRANQNYELVLFDRLSVAEQEMFSDLQKQPDFYGILRPLESSGLSIKSVSQSTALLYLTLREPGRLPSYAHVTAGENYEAAIAKLVLDQILEIEDGGEFVSSARAYDLLYGAYAATEASSRIGQLSIQALQYGQALSVSDIMELSARLYNYQRIPVSSRWQQQFPEPEKVAEVLGVDERGRHRRLVKEHWQAVEGHNGATAERAAHLETPAHNHTEKQAPHTSKRAVDENFVGWLSWNARRTPMPTHRDGSTYKLYISPLPEFVREAFGITFKTLSATAAFHFKVGANLEGILRPDKMVSYFSSFEDLQAAAEMLSNHLEGCPAHGVPFTAELAGEGLLSWGVDPPETQQLVSWQPRESWRLWLTNRLANALLAARSAPRGNGPDRLEPWQYALQRLRLEGVDTDLWTPAPQIWQ